MVIKYPKPASPPTLADLAAQPPGIVSESIEGVHCTMIKPRMRHPYTTPGIGADQLGPFGKGRGGPGGWWIISEPGIDPYRAKLSRRGGVPRMRHFVEETTDRHDPTWEISATLRGNDAVV